MNYDDFIASKVKRVQDAGFEVGELNPELFDFQKHIVTKALKKGRYAIFADCGLGKTFMQLEWAHKVNLHTGKPVLILAPLAVSSQTIKEGKKFGIDVCKVGSGDIQITNYEQLKNVDVSIYSGVVLDESSILKNFNGKLKNLIIDSFVDTPYKLACTATPSPNDPMELGNHSEFLGLMKRNEMLAMYFVHDGGDTSKWRLKGHATSQFYSWVSSWATMISKPSDIGFDSEGYELPDLNFIERQVKTEDRDNGLLFNDVAVSATNFNQELRVTLIKRLEQVKQIVDAKPDEPFIIWVKHNEESDKIAEMIDGAVQVKGSDKPEVKEDRLLGFARGEFRVLVTKTKIAQFGLNYQHCNNQIFASLDFSFEGLYQAIRRSYRFGQTNEVNIYMITTDTMQNVIKSINDKQIKFTEMQQAMSKQVSAKENEIHTYNHEEHESNSFTMMRGDCVRRIQELPDNSVHMSVFSPPFADLYVYSDEPEDMSNVSSLDEFWTNYDFFAEQLFRVMMPGRLVAIHCIDIPTSYNKWGYLSIYDFVGELIRRMQKNGFYLHCKVSIWKDPVIEVTRTKSHQLLYKQCKKDASIVRTALPDNLIVFRKKGTNEIPITHQDQDDSKANYLPVELWAKYASPVWYDIKQTNVLNRHEARTEKDEKHITCLQLDTISRALHLWSNEGETILSPFAGIGSEGFQSIKMNRKFIGIELKKSYYDLAVKNCLSAELKANELSLF